VAPRDLRLVLPALAAWAAAASAIALPAVIAALVAGAAWAVTAIAVVHLLRRSGLPRGLPRGGLPGGRLSRGRPRRGSGSTAATIALAAAVVGLVGASVVANGQLRHAVPLEPGQTRAGSASLTVTSALTEAGASGFGGAGGGAGTAAGSSSGAGGGERMRFEATLDGFASGASEVPARSPVLVFATLPQNERPAIGASVVARGSLTALDRGGALEYLLFVRGDVTVRAGPPWYLAWAAALRSAFRSSTAQLPGDGGLLLPGLAVGDDSAVTPDLTDAMLVSGLTHLTAVSGANCAIVVSAVMLVGGALGLRRRWRIALSLVVLVLFVVLVTPEPSVLRAAVMAGIVLTAMAMGRPSGGIPPLCLSVVLLLSIDPWLALSAGFALSVLATGGLLVLTSPIAALLARWLPRPMALALAVPIGAHLACQPVLLLLSPQLTPYTVPANVLAEPAAAAVSVAGLVVCGLSVLAPPVASAAAWLPWVPAAWIGAVARFFAAAPGAAIPLPDGAAAAALTVLLTALAITALVLARSRPRVSRASALLVVAVFAVIAGSVSGSGLARDAAVPAQWQAAACDIGQGDAVLVHSRDQVALVDVGPDPEPLTACLARFHVERIDLLVLTHYDLDHVGGLDAVIGRVDRALVGPPDSDHDRALRTRLAGGGAQVVAAERGMSGSLGEDRWDVLWPRPGATITGNEASVTVLFTGALRMLFLGDLGERAQDAVLSANALGQVDVVKVAHHGSADQSETMYRRIAATVGLISVGIDNDYGHPTDRLLDILARVGTQAFRTDLQGAIVVSGSSGAVSVWTERSVPP
jgi:competence protein ComEC